MDIGQWLRGLGLQQYEQAFRDNGIDVDVLPRLTGDDLKPFPLILKRSLHASSNSHILEH